MPWYGWNFYILHRCSRMLSATVFSALFRILPHVCSGFSALLILPGCCQAIHHMAVLSHRFLSVLHPDRFFLLQCLLTAFYPDADALLTRSLLPVLPEHRPRKPESHHRSLIHSNGMDADRYGQEPHRPDHRRKIRWMQDRPTAPSSLHNTDKNLSHPDPASYCWSMVPES